MNKTPNFKDPRIQKRVQHAYVFTKIIQRSDKRDHELSSSLLTEHFGQAQTPIGNWLRSTLLTCTSNSYCVTTGRSKRFAINQQGQAIVRQVLKTGECPTVALDYILEDADPANIKYDDFLVKTTVERAYKDQMESGNFVYEDKSNRLWHPIQNIKRNLKKSILADNGYVFNYDIEASAPTLILQHAQAHGMDEYLFHINSFLKNRVSFREHIASELDIPVQTAKVIINALFCGARLGASQEFALFHVLKCDRSRMNKLKSLESVIGLRADIKKCWDAIKSSMPRRQITDCNGKARMLAINSKQKWNRYFELERTVLNAVRKWLNANGIKHFAEHDGWATQEDVDLQSLQQYVLDTTGYSINIARA